MSDHQPPAPAEPQPETPVTPDDWRPRPGHMHPVDEAFYRVAVKERDYERRRVDVLVADRNALRAKVTELEDLLDGQAAQHDCTLKEWSALRAENERLRKLLHRSEQLRRSYDAHYRDCEAALDGKEA